MPERLPEGNPPFNNPPKRLKQQQQQKKKHYNLDDSSSYVFGTSLASQTLRVWLARESGPLDYIISTCQYLPLSSAPSDSDGREINTTAPRSTNISNTDVLIVESLTDSAEIKL